MADTVLFDLFGVIARQQSPSAREVLRATAGVPAPAFWATYWALRTPYDRGEVTAFGYWRQVATALGSTVDDRQINRLIAADVASWSVVDDDMVAVVERAAASGRRLALLSNIPEELAAHYERHHRWLRHFDVVAFSCRTSHVKPEPDAYRWCCRALDLAPGRILFIDDRVENIQAAEAIGMRAHLFISPTQAHQAITELDTVPRRR
ncbi:HAD family hydrolase [Micromonospora tarensis]|uniref:HAD family phosphatase n=1 Tax=Micromonospora tarensis TaxID=2806100 RepID=A0ABS1YIL1_9ACTN|nr:HAD family phosphatase [Micromonospora tarensis]MBM0277267.1 HAD family phosphatase [Micromonospora tarensis]